MKLGCRYIVTLLSLGCRQTLGFDTAQAINTLFGSAMFQGTTG